MIVVPVEKGVDWKRPPIVLSLIVLVNILVFIFYQSGDDDLLKDAVQQYYDEGLIDQEWAAYKAYARRRDLPFELDKSQPEMLWYIVSDSGFDQFLEKHHSNYIDDDELASWREARDRVEDLSSKISITAYGLDSNNITPTTTISYQFLHGGVMHIVGNLVFLVLTGFAVEAALGSIRFLVYYLLAGVGSAFLFALIQNSSGVYGGNLVGASGSISGVMAMYVVLFGMRKIRFFYWLFVFTGYFRAAAIIMLPIYICFELYNMFTNEGSNVAYTAHIGGFIVGALLVWLNMILNKSAVDEQYLDGEKEEVDPFAQALQKLYLTVSQCDFAKAWQQLKELKKAYPNRHDLVDVEYQLVRALHVNKEQDYLLHRIGKQGNSRQLTLAMVNNWRVLNEDKRAELAFERKSLLLEDALDQNCLEVAELIFKELQKEPQRELDVAVLARRLAVFCEISSNGHKSTHYNDVAASLAGNTAKLGAS